MNFIYKVDRNIVEEIDFGSKDPESTATEYVIVSHDSKYDVEVLGMYIKPKSEDYSGSRDPFRDYNDVLYWGDNWDVGLSLIQPANGLTTLIKSKIGSSRDYPILLLQNNGIIKPRGRRADYVPIVEKSNTKQSIYLGAEIPLYEALTGYTALYNSTNQIGIVTGGSNTNIRNCPRVEILVDNQPLFNGDYQVYGYLRTPHFTEAELAPGSQEIDGIGNWFILYLYTDTGPYSITKGFTYIYKTREYSTFYDEFQLGFKLEVPYFVSQAIKLDVGFEINYREIK